MSRDAYIDNIKGYLIILVVLGHTLALVNYNFDIGRSLFMFIYVFHMPALTFVSGYLSSEEKGGLPFLKLFRRLLIPYIIFQIILSLIRLAYNPVNTKELLYVVFLPQFGLWYIFCLFFWRACLPYFVKLPHYLPLSFLIGLIWGFVLPAYGFVLSSSRIVAFFPFFLLGYQAKKNHWISQRIANSPGIKYKAASAVILLCVLVCSFIFDVRFLFSFQYIRFYQESGQPILTAFFMRAVAYSIATSTVISFIALVPNSYSRITRIGERSLYVYLLHLPIINYFRYSKALNGLTDYYYWGIALLSLIIPLLLSSDIIQRITMPIIEPGKRRIPASLNQINSKATYPSS